jgi:DNA-binding MarR family transcriptional regulator
MGRTVLDELIGISQKELELLRMVNGIGAASADELAVKLRRAGDDLTPEIQDLVKRKLLQKKTLQRDSEKLHIYLASRKIRPLL